MANPQRENGHTDIAHDILDAFCRFRMPGEVRQIVDTVIRKTYGWQKKADEISNSQFVEMTKMNKGNVRRAVAKATTHLLIVVQSDYKYRFNKDYDKWIPFKTVAKVTTGKSNQSLSKVTTPVVQSDYKSLSKVNNTNTNKETNNTNTNTIIELFKPINPSYKTLYPRTTQRAAIERMVKEHGEQWLVNLLQVLPAICSRPYAPDVSTPLKLETNLGRLQQFIQQNKLGKKQVVNVQEEIERRKNA